MDEKVRQNLVDAGCSEGFIDDYAAAGSGSEQLCRLRQHRKGDDRDLPEIDPLQPAQAAARLGAGALRTEADREPVHRAFAHQGVDLSGTGDGK